MKRSDIQECDYENKVYISRDLLCKFEYTFSIGHPLLTLLLPPFDTPDYIIRYPLSEAIVGCSFH